MTEGLFNENEQTINIAQDRNKLFVKIQNFRSIRSLEVELDNVTQLIGRNNSGKSNICQALVKAVNLEKTEIDDYYNKNDSNPILVELTHGGNPFRYEASKCGKFAGPRNPPIQIIYLPAIPDADDVVSEVGTKALGQVLKMIKPEKSNKIDRILDRAVKCIEKIDRENLQSFKERLLEDFKQVDNSFINIDYSPSELKREDLLKKRTLMLCDEINSFQWSKWGHGTQRLMILLIYLQLAKLYNDISNETLLILEEPEIFMHPQQQRAIAEKLYKDADNPFFKILISTHSPFFIDPFKINTIRIVSKKNGITNIHNQGKPSYDYDLSMLLKKGIIKPDTYIYKFYLSLRLEPELREFFFADKVLIVEGYSDRIIIPWMIDRFYNKYRLFSRNISIFNSKGNCNIEHYIEILERFDIPFTIIMDNDNNCNTDTNKAINALKRKLGDDFDKKVVLINGDACSLFGLKNENKDQASEYDVYHRIAEIENDPDLNEKIKTSFNQCLEELMLKLGNNFDTENDLLESLASQS